MTRPKARAEPIPGTPKHFFEVALPHLVLASLHAFLERQGTLSFDVRGVGQWSFSFGCEEPVREGLADDAELSLSFAPAAFDAFLDGSLDVVSAVRSGDITAAGTELELLEDFGRLLRPPGEDLGWEAG